MTFILKQNAMNISFHIGHLLKESTGDTVKMTTSPISRRQRQGGGDILRRRRRVERWIDKGREGGGSLRAWGSSSTGYVGGEHVARVHRT